METMAKDAVILQSMYGSEHPCSCVPGEYCHWQCICDTPKDQQVKPDTRINIGSGEDVFV
jgi:hypothetical protein